MKKKTIPGFTWLKVKEDRDLVRFVSIEVLNFIIAIKFERKLKGGDEGVST